MFRKKTKDISYDWTRITFAIVPVKEIKTGIRGTQWITAMRTISEGRKAAREVDQYLMGTTNVPTKGRSIDSVGASIGFFPFLVSIKNRKSSRFGLLFLLNVSRPGIS